jgi:hypothetical protein
MKSFLDALRAVAREHETDAAALPAVAVPELPQDARARIVEAILRAQTAPASRGDAVVEHKVSAASSGRSSASSERARRGRGTRRSFFVFAAGVAAVAAAIVIGVRPAVDDLSLPSYRVTAEGGAQEVRGAASDEGERDPTVASRQRVRAGSTLIVGLRPDTSVSGEVATRAFVAQGADVSEVHPQSRLAPSGAVQLQFQGAALMDTRRGPATLRVVVGRGRAVESVDLRHVIRESAGPGWRAVTVPLVFEADAE